MKYEKNIILDERLYNEVLKAYDMRGLEGLNQFSNIMISNEQFAKFLNAKRKAESKNKDEPEHKTEYTKDQIRHSFDRLMQEGKNERRAIGKYMYTRPTKQIAITQKPHDNKQDKILCTPLVYNIYNKFKTSHVGANSAISMRDLANYFAISERKVRDIINRINYRGFNLKNDETFKRKIFGSENGYYMISNNVEKRAMRNMIVTRLLKQVECLEIFDQDINIDNQIKFDFNTMKAKLTKSISNDITTCNKE